MKPVFVFDGKAPKFKKETLLEREISMMEKVFRALSVKDDETISCSLFIPSLFKL